MRRNPFIPREYQQEDYATRYRREHGIADENNGDPNYYDAFFKGAKAQSAGVIGGQADMLEQFTGVGDGVADYMQEVQKSNARGKEYGWRDMLPGASDYWTNPWGAAYDIGGGIGSSATLLGETLLAGKALGAAGLSAVGAKLTSAIGSKAAAAGMPWVGKLMETPAGKALVANVMSTPLEAFSEGGNKAREVAERGGSEEEQRDAALQTAGWNMALMPFLNAIESAGLGGLIAKSGGKETFLNTMKGVLGDAVQNTYEEGMQESISEYADNPNGKFTDIVNPFGWSEQAYNAAAVGGVTGGVQGGVGVAGGKAMNAAYDKYFNQQPSNETEAEEPLSNEEQIEEAVEGATNDMPGIVRPIVPGLVRPVANGYIDGQYRPLVEQQEEAQKVEEPKSEPTLINQNGLFPLPRTFDDKVKQSKIQQISRNAQINNTNLNNGYSISDISNQLNRSFNPPHINKQTMPSKLVGKKERYALQRDNKTNKMPDIIQEEKQVGLNNSNMPIGVSRSAQEMGKAANLLLAARGIDNKPKGLFDKPDVPKVDDVNRAADRLMVEQYINQAFDQRQPFMPQGYGSTTRQEQGQLLANLLNARAASEWDKAAGLTREQRRSNMPFVPQRASLYNGALRRNLERLDRIKPDELPSVSNETTDVNRRAAEIQRLREQVIPQSRENAKKFAAPALLEERGKAKARSISLQARSRVREDAILADERKAKKHAKERYEAVKNDVIGFIVPYKTIKEQLKGVNFLRKSVVEQLHEQLEPIYSELVKGMGHGVTDEWVEKGTHIPTDVGDLIGHPEAGKNSHTADHLRYSNNAPWYQQWFKRYGRKPRKAEIYQVAEDILTNRGDSWAWPDKMYNGSPEANQYLAEVREDIDMKHDYINACDVVKQELKNGKLFTEADYKQVDLPQEVQNAQTEKTAESKGNDENSVLERNPQEQADYQGENKNGEAEEIEKEEPAKQIKTTVEKSESKPVKKSGAASVINDYKHTTKKTMIKAAKLDKDFSDDEFKEAKELAEENGGFYSKYASQKLRTKGVFLFEKGGAEGRDAFIAALNEKFGDKQEASVEPALERGITRDVDAEQNNKARERIAAENKNESQENKGYRTSNRDWGTTVNVKNNEVTISFNKRFGNMPPIKFTVAEYQKAAVSSVNRLSGIRKFLMPKVDAHNQEWIDAAPNENVRLAREDDVAMHGKDLADVLQKLVDTVMEKAGIEAADINTLFNRAKTKNVESKEDVQKAEVERVAKEVSKEPSLGMYARKGDQADFVRHYMNVAEDTISELGEDEPLSIDSVSTKELEKMFTPHMVKLYDEIRAKDKSVVKVTESAKQKQLKADFGDAETATNELAAALGIKRKQKAESKPAPKKKAFDIVDDSDEALAKAIKEAKAELNKLSANPVFNPALHKAAFKVGAILIQRGTNNFVEWSAKMLEMLGEKIRPWLGSVWKSIEAYPKNEKFDDEKATAATRYVGAKYNEGYTTVEDIYNAFAMDFDPENLEAYKGLIDSAFAGIDELYNPTLDTADTKNVVQSSKENTAKEVEANDVDARGNAGEKENSSDGGSNRRGLPKREKNLQTREDRDTRPDQVLGRKQAENDSTPKETRNIKSVRNNENSDSGRQISGESGRGDVRDGRTGTSVPVQADVAGEPRRGNSEPRRITENYHIDNPDALIGGTPRVRFSRNKKAIEIAQDLIGNDRPVTAEERDALAGYIGWGSFGQELFQGSWEKPVYKDGWEDENNWLRETLGEQAWKEAQNSIINAHYTDPYTINAMWEMARQLGFKGGRVLEPSMGVGNFFGLMPKDLAEKSKLTGIELDQTTGRMAQVLYPEANVQIKGYQDSHTPEGFYDFIIGNVPFGNFSIASRKYNKLKPLIHDYFFLKGIDELKSGGIMMAITSKGTMDKADARVRMELAKKADLVAAYRLPTGAFDQYAGTNVVTDILVFKKLDKPRIGVSNLEWVNATKYEVEFEGKDQSYYMNDYFKNHPENVLGKIEYGHGTTTGRPGLTVKRLSDFAERLEAIPYEVPQNIFSASNSDANIQYISNHTGKEQGSLTLEGDKLYTVYGDVLKPLEDTKSYAVKDIKKTTARVQEFKDWMQLRDTLGELYDAERKDGQDMEQIRKKLNQQFDDYCEKYVKPSMAKENSPAFRQSYANKFLDQINEPFAARVQALVSNTGEKTSIFFKRTIRGNSVDIDNPTIAQALIMQRNESMVLDVDRIAELAHKSKAETIKELLDKNIVFKTPAGNYETKDNYLAGNVRQKLKEAEDALNNGDKDMKHNVEELKKVIPPTVPYYQISAPLGSSWIPNETYIDFIAHLLGGNRNGIALNKTKNYSVSIEKNNGLGTASKIYGSDDVPFARMLTHAFNHTKPTITKKDSEGNTYRDEQAMQRAADQLEKIYDEFSNWLWKDSSRKISLENAYNEAMNSIAVPTYDGSFMDMPGMALERGESPFSLRQHQLNAIYRGLLNGSGIYAHEVGTGKTYTMAGLAIESRRYGLAKKPLLLAFNANSASVAKEINDMYPGAKVLYIDNLDRKSIQLRLNQIKTDDWDCVVMPHSLADKLSFREETLNAMAEQQIYELEQAAIAAAKEEDEELTVEDMEKLRLAEADKGEERKKLPYIKSQTAKKLVTMRNQVINQIKQQALNSTDEDAIAFEDLGIDMVMVDEAHAFKKPPFTTTRNIKGLTVTTSNRSIKLSFISQYIQSLHNGKGIHLFTGTPITNTLTEMYHMMKYVMPNAMEDAGVKDFDSWMNSFAEEVSDMEFTSTGDVELVSRLAAFTNVPELRRFVGQYWDTVFADDMPEFKPRETKSGKNIGDKLTEEEQDELVNGYTEDPQGRPYKKVIVETLQLTKSQQEILDELVKKAKNWAEADGRARREIRKTEFHATPLLIGNDASIAAMDPRLYDLNVDTTGEETKKDRCVKNVLKIYNEGTKQHPTVQVIFSDVGYSDTKDQSTPNPEGGPSIKRKVPTFNLSKAIVEDLVKGGIPENEIVVMKASYSAEKRAQIADELKTGKYRVVIGSTATLGVGVNMQDNLRAMHHLDCPWMPGDLVQRNGRGHRQGNHWNTVLEYRYVTEKLDTKRWQTVLRKDAFITSFMKSKVGDVSSRSFEMGADDVGDSAADSDLLKTLAEASGDPRIILQKKYETNLTKLERKERTFLAGIEDMKASLIAAKKGIENAQLAYETSVKDAKRFLDNKPEPFEISLVNSLKPTVKRELVKFDNRTEAQKHLQQILSEVMNFDTDNNIGEYAGFKIIVKKVRSDMEGKYVPEISIKGDQKYTCGTPSVQAITMKPASIAKLADDEKAKKARLEEEVKRLEIAVQEKFPQQEQLDRTKKQLEDIKLDRLMSPTPPPKWLMEGVNVDSMFYVDKDPYILTGYRANSDGYYLVGTKNDGTEKIFPFQDATDIQGMPVYDMAEHVPSPVYKAPKAENPEYSIAPQTAYHGSNRVFNEFRLDHSKEGHGDLTHGYGVYFAADEKIANSYRRDLSGMAAGMEFTIRGENYRYDSEDNVFRGTSGNEISINAKTPEGLLANAFYMTEDADDAVEYLKEQQQKASEKLKPMYQKALELARKGNLVVNLGGATYESLIPSVEEMIDEDATYSEQPEVVKRGIDKAFNELGAQKQLDEVKRKDLYGNNIYVKLMQAITGDNSRVDETMYFIDENEDVARQASELLDKHGVKGLRYDGEVDGEAFVVFNEKAIEIKRRYEANLERAAQRTREEVLNEVKKALPTAKISYDSKGNLIAEMPNSRKVGVVVEDRILLNQQQAKSAGKAHNTIANEAEGYWNAWEKLNGSDVLGVIHVSRNSRVGTAFHEVLHAAMDLSLTAKEKEALYKHFKKAAEKSGRDIDEEIADGYKDWVLKRQQGQGSLFGKLYKKAVDFLNKLYTMFVNANNVGNIFRKIENGKVYDEKYSGVLYEQKAMKSIRASIAQAISSAETSIKQIPAIFKKIPWQSGTVNIDIGGGKFDLATDFAKEKGVENIVFDPFNRDYDHNSKAFEKIKKGGDTVTVANVLNVIAEENARDNVILQAARALKPNGTAYFGIYEGSKDGVGKVTSKGWQNNKKAGDYISEVEKHFNNVRKAGNIIIAKEPNLTADEKAVWSMDDTWQNTVKYSVNQERQIDYDEKIEPSYIMLVNDVDRQKVAKIAESMENNGYDGRPIVVLDDANEGYRALTGSHRIAAAKELDIDIPAIVIDNNDATATLLDVYNDEELAQVAKELYDNGDIDERAYNVLKDEQNHYDDIKYSVAPTEKKLVSTFTNTKRKNIVETAKDWFAEKRKNFYRDWFDKNDRLHDFDKAIEMGIGKKVSEDKKVYSKVQTLPATSAGMATALIEGNADHIKVINDRLKHKKLKHNATMQMVLNVINKSKMDKLHPSWLKENGFDSWINALGAYLGSARLLEMSKRAKEEGVEYKFPNGLTSEELMNYIAKAPAEFKRAADLYYKFNDNMLTIMEDAGLISEETHRVLNEKYKHYCPLMRDFSDTAAADAFIGGLSNGGRGIANVSNPLKRISIEGSERNVFNPLESTVNAVSVICNRAERNKVGQMAVELAQEAGLENVVVEVEGDKPDEKNCIFTVMHNGKKQAYRTSQELYGPIVGYNLPAAGLMLGVARSAAHLLRTGATMSPSFIVRNLIRDTIFAGVASKNGFVPILDTIRGAQALLKDEKRRAEFETAGITKFNFYNTADEIARSLDEMAGGKEWRNYSPSDLWRALMKYPIMTSEFVESATRMGEFLKAREKGMSVDDAARAARELTLDFSRSGVTGEKVNQIVPFFNACLQGGDKLYRMLCYNTVPTAINIAKYIVLPSLILWAFNHDEDWYKELDPNIKNTNWILPGGYRIPKPQDVGVIFGSGIEAMLDIASGKDKEAMNNWAETIKNNMAPNIIPTLFLPILEWQANYSYFRGGALVNRRLQQLPDELQYTNSTSELSKAIGSVTGLSPVKIDNTIRGYTGTMGMFLAQAPDMVIGDKRNLPEKRLSERVFLRDFNVTDMNLNRSVDEFYDMLADANKQHAGYGKKGKPSKVVKSIRNAGKMISDLNKDIQTITNSRLSPSIKRARIDKKRAEIKRIANIAVTKYGKYFD